MIHYREQKITLVTRLCYLTYTRFMLGIVPTNSNANSSCIAVCQSSCFHSLTCIELFLKNPFMRRIVFTHGIQNLFVSKSAHSFSCVLNSPRTTANLQKFQQTTSVVLRATNDVFFLPVTYIVTTSKVCRLYYKDNHRQECIRVANARLEVIIFCKSRPSDYCYLLT